MKTKLVIYQVFTRTFGNKNLAKKENGTLAENGAGKMNDFDEEVLRRIHDFGVTHLWYTGVIRHATCTDYSTFGIPQQNPRVVKGRAGSPYAITDYYDIDPDIAVDVNERMAEFEALVARTHAEGMKVIIDFVPNHVARQYKSIAKPQGVEDLGEGDDTGKHFDSQNNFYYCPGEQLDLSGVVENDYAHYAEPYYEYPAKCTGNDRFDSHPQQNDWYETVKLNYGVDYCDAGGRSYHYNPVPSTWKKMTDILLFWAEKGIDGFRCDMAEMVPHEFWAYATQQVKERYPGMIFIGEVYDPNQYRMYVESGFDYLYDKVGLYDCIRGVICDERPASSITHEWQQVDDIRNHMLYFLENHDEQRIAFDFFAGNPWKGVPGMIVSALLQQNPVMVYAGQEFGEKGMDKEGFSGQDGRSTIFDYWASDAVYKGFFNHDALTTDEKKLSLVYQGLLRFCNREKAVREGQTFDLMYVNNQSYQFNPRKQFAFLRKADEEVLLVVANFDQKRVHVNVTVPSHAYDFLGLPEQEVEMTDLLSGFTKVVELKRDGQIALDVAANFGRIYKFNIKTKTVDYVLNTHNKEEFPPAHTAEHLLNQVMFRMFGAERSSNAHIERKKSKMTFVLDHKPNRKEEKAIEDEMNRLIAEDLPVTFEMIDRNNIPEGVNIDKLPEDASEMLRLVRIGDFDVCLCIGKHVRSTAQIGRFEMLGTNWDEQKRTFRIRFKVIPA
ncbi:alpha-amylase family glycosyl hydrolase [Prevotella fusca]|uniref:Alpha-amylase n=1 Tax=Prevotella fusca JCM 17724 TaxID=1236517 RepID=A0ABX7XVZ0_9BACT|nr:alpha-amylase family glycosyl hydrolase [Prevotella fusca]QUB85710.1 alpha-amylase [Prevotella fusca JCM 17724]